ncbi:acyl carrier protein [Streptomyces sp. NA04227]|uniref:acyl carrier protein n=1 Tax=Streptomyces sp. NA04227 TaxID=2742136 RepID=UPI001591F7C7|nr:acyl carrier protein [Streptomyces sp. NA04227]QKW06903.1 acyl carrier protein [Streptomyces sp. NA04227]
MYDNTAVATELRGLLESVVGTKLPLDEPGARTVSLWNLGLTSAAFMRLLAEVEDGFGVEWDLDDSSDAVSSFDALVEHVAKNAKRLPSGAAAGEAR